MLVLLLSLAMARVSMAFTVTVPTTSRVPIRSLNAMEGPSDTPVVDPSTTTNAVPYHRRDFLSSTATALLGTGLTVMSVPSTAHADAEDATDGTADTTTTTTTTKSEGVQLFKTRTGLQYIETKIGTGPSPQYGQLCVIRYTGYVKLPGDSPIERFDSSDYLVHHGNGRVVAGLDEGLHTMKEGGVRRVIIPPKLGYVSGDVGPVPSGPWDRRKLVRLLDRMVDVRGGNVIFDVELLRVLDDEADQGYYQDEGLSAEEFEQLQRGIQGAKERNSLLQGGEA